jgi:hypothetical protein
MFGSNYFGEPYYGQGPTVSTVYIFETVSATVSTSATIGTQSIVNQILNATVSTAASIAKFFGRTLATATVGIMSASTLGQQVLKALKIRQATTKFLFRERKTMIIPPRDE